ncbi:MAG TPA: hypothetical protein VI749_06970 [Candidatus Omnitrophota bacterium]|nr:hypothetical protein [Candidatus Omnitrophota bacterium]
MTKIKGSKDGRTWEETARQRPDSRYSVQQTIKNLTVLKDWCEKKISELTEK